MLPAEQNPSPAAPQDYDRGAERVFAAIVASCDPGADFTAKVDAGLRSSLSLLAADPSLARAFTGLSAEADVDAWRRREHWQRRYASLLAAAAPDGRRPFDFLEPMLVSGVHWLVAQRVAVGQAEDLEQLLPDLREFILAFYR